MHESNEEDDGRQSVDEEPMLIDGRLVKEEDCSFLGFGQEIAGKSRDPAKDLEPSIALQDEESDNLLYEETDDDRGPVDMGSVVADEPEKGLEDEEAKDGDGTVPVIRALYHLQKDDDCVRIEISKRKQIEIELVLTDH